MLCSPNEVTMYWLRKSSRVIARLKLPGLGCRLWHLEQTCSATQRSNLSGRSDLLPEGAPHPWGLSRIVTRLALHSLILTASACRQLVAEGGLIVGNFSSTTLCRPAVLALPTQEKCRLRHLHESSGSTEQNYELTAWTSRGIKFRLAEE